VKKYRPGLVYTALAITYGGAFGLAWFLAVGSLQPPLWVLALASAVNAVLADQTEKALGRWHARRQRPRRRAHARTTQTHTERKAA
jgi:hypothetical protein